MHEYHDRYAKYDPRNIRENPKDELEQSLAEEEAAREVELFLDRHRDSPNFRRRVAVKIAQREILENNNNNTGGDNFNGATGI